MKIVLDTNVVISGTFFDGTPNKLISAIGASYFDVYATQEIIEEYQETVEELIERKQGSLREDILSAFISKLNVIESTTEISICRDPDDNKFIECAIDAKALYIVSGDKDLLTIKEYEGIEIITVAEFVEKYIEQPMEEPR